MLPEHACVQSLWGRELTSNVMVASAVSDCPAPGASEQTCLPDGCLPKESIKRVAYASSTSARRESKNETLHKDLSIPKVIPAFGKQPYGPTQQIPTTPLTPRFKREKGQAVLLRSSVTIQESAALKR